MNILVTGAAGFLGRHLITSLLTAGHNVFALDNFSSYGNEKWPLEPATLAKSLKDVKFFFRKGDICNPLELKGMMRTGWGLPWKNLDQIYNLACMADPSAYRMAPLETIRANTEGVRNLLELAKEKKARMLHLSSSEVYGPTLVRVQRECDYGAVDPVGDRACYREGKRISETIINEFVRMNPEVSVRILRPFNVYGPEFDLGDQRIIPRSMMSALLGNNPRVSHGSRSYLFVHDAIRGMRMAMDLETERGKILGPWNLGKYEPTLNGDVIRRIYSLAGKGFYPSYYETTDEMIHRAPDVDAFQKATGWEPRIGLAEGLSSTWAWLKDSVQKKG